MDQLQALAARHGLAIRRRDAFDFGAVGSLAISRVAEDHAVLVEGVEIAFNSPVGILHFHLTSEVTGSTMSSLTTVPGGMFAMPDIQI